MQRAVSRIDRAGWTARRADAISHVGYRLCHAQKHAKLSSGGSRGSWRRQTRLCAGLGSSGGLRLMLEYTQIEQMDVEVQSVPREHKTKLQVKLRSYKGDLARYKSEVVSRPFSNTTAVPQPCLNIDF